VAMELVRKMQGNLMLEPIQACGLCLVMKILVSRYGLQQHDVMILLSRVTLFLNLAFSSF